MPPGVPIAILRKGKWTTEEELYANKIIDLFNKGLLNVSSGTTLRSYLSDRLSCDPMRITKKFAGASCIGKQVFTPADITSPTELARVEADVKALEAAFRSRLSCRPVSAATAAAESPRNVPRGTGYVSHPRQSSQNRNYSLISTGSRTGLTDQYGYDDVAPQHLPHSARYTTARPTDRASRNVEPKQKKNTPRRVHSTPNLAFVQSDMDIAWGVEKDESLAMQQQALKRTLKRSHSSLSISECDDLVANSDAASNLFLSFVDKLSVEMSGGMVEDPESLAKKTFVKMNLDKPNALHAASWPERAKQIKLEASHHQSPSPLRKEVRDCHYLHQHQHVELQREAQDEAQEVTVTEEVTQVQVTPLSLSVAVPLSPPGTELQVADQRGNQSVLGSPVGLEIDSPVDSPHAVTARVSPNDHPMRKNHLGGAVTMCSLAVKSISSAVVVEGASNFGGTSKVLFMSPSTSPLPSHSPQSKTLVLSQSQLGSPDGMVGTCE